MEFKEHPGTPPLGPYQGFAHNPVGPKTCAGLTVIIISYKWCLVEFVSSDVEIHISQSVWFSRF